MLSDFKAQDVYSIQMCLNAPYGARCFLTSGSQTKNAVSQGLNAPYGARCFLTPKIELFNDHGVGLNAPYGARCFLTNGTSAHYNVDVNGS